jgi:hypothetical protein
MVDQVIIDALTLKSREFAVRWKNMVRKASQLKHYNTQDDETLIQDEAAVFPMLAKTIDRGFDPSLVGGFFVNLGKARMRDGYPISEVIYAINLTERTIIEYIMTDFAPESPTRMYRAIGLISQVSEFFLRACFYLTKGYLEAVYTKMNNHDKVSEELLKKYFKDDFFLRED